jgi:uncharacterized protein (DUF433 family)
MRSIKQLGRKDENISHKGVGMMSNQELLDRITFDSQVMCGKATIRGMRITVEQILKFLAAGGSAEELFKDFPELEAADICAVLLYASQLVAEEHVYLLKAA